ncbi:MAG: release factor glutamine methyltransferase [Mycobacterium sp.]|jgi:release factor glutamine methyltransferase|nr:release factor glutamine methyltransferase [Mycobacterium sp.]
MPTLTTTYPAPGDDLVAGEVYQPQHDSWLLVDTMRRSALIPRRRVLDLCTGSGFIAIAAAEMGCASVTAFDICPHAVRCSQGNAAGAGVDVDVRRGSWTKALGCDPFDVVVSNPPYVPAPPERAATEAIPGAVGPSWAWNAGPDGRLVLDPLCRSASKLLRDGGSVLLVQSAFAGVQRSLRILNSTGLDAGVIASQWIPFGPVLTARAGWLELTGRLRRGCRREELVVIRADKR